MDGGLPRFEDREASVGEIRRQIRQQFRIYVVVVAVVSLAVGGMIGAFATRGRSSSGSVELTPPPYWALVPAPDSVAPTFDAPATVTPPPLSVYVTGAVANPGVVTVPAGSLLVDALEAVGGSTSDADLESVNLAAPLVDNQHISVPQRVASATVAPPNATGGDLVNVNTATAVELETLPHIGPAMAQRIIDFREENGPFARKEDLQNVAGIGETRYNDIAPLITVGE